jgi:hypothetical protein
VAPPHLCLPSELLGKITSGKSCGPSCLRRRCMV